MYLIFVTTAGCVKLERKKNVKCYKICKSLHTVLSHYNFCYEFTQFQV